MGKDTNKITTIETKNISDKIYLVGEKQVIFDNDLAEIYGVETKRVNEAVKNNPNKFPSDFYFELNDNEFDSLQSNFSTTNLKSKVSSSSWGGKRKPPKVFTEQGIYMLATILKSKTATDVTVAIMRTFVNMRTFLAHNASIFQRFDIIETKQLQYQLQIDKKISKLFKAIESKEIKPSEGIFYNGQIFDAWQFVSDLIKSSKISIILIDNYIDESILTLLSKRKSKVTATIYTTKISKPLALDLKKHNTQYPKIELRVFKKSHDRFLIIDNKTVYHIGASLKDLGKKWFAFSRIGIDAKEIVNRLLSTNSTN